MQIRRERKQVEWNTFALVTTIELARDDKRNPAIPTWLEKDYFAAIAVAKGQRTLGRMLPLYSEDEWFEMENRLLS